MPALISARNRGSWASLRPRSARKRPRWNSRIEFAAPRVLFEEAPDALPEILGKVPDLGASQQFALQRLGPVGIFLRGVQFLDEILDEPVEVAAQGMVGIALRFVDEIRNQGDQSPQHVGVGAKQIE